MLVDRTEFVRSFISCVSERETNLKHQSELKDVDIIHLQLNVVEGTILTHTKSGGRRSLTQLTDIITTFVDRGGANRSTKGRPDEGEDGRNFQN